jgi:peptidoglycan/LPS O-acetylase OafA/YrhL
MMIYVFYGNFGMLQQYIDSYNYLDIGSLFFLVLTNITIFGQDVVMFLGLDKHTGLLYFTSNFYQSDPQVFRFLLIPQAWSIGVELLFYLLAPIIVTRKTRYLFGIIGLSLFIRIGLIYLGYHNDPWSYRFFPTELAFFVSGALSYRIYNYLKRYKLGYSNFYFILMFLISFTILFQYIPVNNYIKMGLYYISVVLCIPFAFIFNKDNKIDQKIGELSYPIYISHYLVIAVLSNMLFYKSNIQFQGFFSGTMTIIFSLILLKFIEEPVYKIRQKRAQQKLGYNTNKQIINKLKHRIFTH